MSSSTANRSAEPAAPLRVTSRLLIHRIENSDHSFVFNPLSGSVDIADAAEVGLLTALQSVDSQIPVDPVMAKHLRDRKMAFSSLEEEERHLEANVDRARQSCTLTTPTMYTVCPTLACNLACAYCFEGDSLLDKAQGVMTATQVDAMLTAISDLERADKELRIRAGQSADASPPTWVSLFGGEPLLPNTRACVERILAGCEDLGMVIGCTTNGVNLRRFESILARFKANLGAFQVTLDGPKAVHDSRRHRLGGQGTFDEIVAGITMLLDLETSVHLRVNLDAANIGSLPELCEFVDAKGWADNDLLDMTVAAVSIHSPGGCQSKYDGALSELQVHKLLLAQLDAHPVVRKVCRPGHLRHLQHLAALLEPQDRQANQNRPTAAAGPRYWYCEQGTGKQWVFTPDGFVYTCTEAVGKPAHAVGRFDPQLEIWKQNASDWLGRTILSHVKCRSCSISTLCGGGCHFAAREHSSHRSANPAGAALLQIAMPGGSGRFGKSPVAPPSSEVEPFCAAAEDIVRDYLTQVGRRFIEMGVVPPADAVHQ